MFELSRQPAKKWDRTAGRPQPISLVPLGRGPLSEERIFTMGSCFALEVRHELAHRGYQTYPRYFDLAFDSGKVAVGKLPERDNVNHYSIASILQEFENVLGPEPLYTPDRFWSLDDGNDRHGLISRFARRNLTATSHRFDVRWQDPFRTLTYAETLEDLTVISSQITEKIREGLEAATLFIITLGMTEIWVDRKSGLAVCNAYGGKVDEHLCEFADMSFADTKEKIAKLVRLIRGFKPGAGLVFTVSPVPLARTARDESVVTANTLSKAKQRVAVDEICREFDDVHYFPSFELCSDGSHFQEDGRHVEIATVKYIVEHFQKWYEGGAAELGAEHEPLELGGRAGGQAAV